MTPNAYIKDALGGTDLAEEDLVKRPCWHAINFVLPFVVSRQWAQMVQDEDGRWKCGPNFKVDQKDVRLAILIANAQLAFQEHFCTNELIWNAQVAQSFLRGKTLTVSLQLYDILRQQSTVSRTLTAMMSSDTDYNSITSYGMLHVIYRLNLFGGGQGGFGGPGGRGGRGGGGFGGGGRGGRGGGGGFGGPRRF